MSRAERPYTGRGADSYAAKLLARLAHPTSASPPACRACGHTEQDHARPGWLGPCYVNGCGCYSYRDADPPAVTRCEPMTCTDCSRKLEPEDGTRCWPCECKHVERTNLDRLARATPTKKRRP